ncbi:MAG: HEPN domain-containing protein [Nitrospira sp.]
MTAPPPREEIQKEILRGEQALRAAQLLLQQLLLQDTLSRSYCAILHAARAALLAEGVTVTSHRGVRRLFGQHLIKTGKLPSSLAEVLADEQDDRILADYDVLFEPELDRVQKRVADAGEFLVAVKTFLTRANMLR